MIRAFSKKFPETELHFLVKQAFSDLLIHNPYVSKIQFWKGSLRETLKDLKGENYDFVFDLHHNQRTFLLKLALGKPSGSFPKLNFKKYLLTVFGLDLLPDLHIVERYAKVLKPFGVETDSEGLDMFLWTDAEQYGKNAIKELPQKPAGIVLGGNYETKKWPLEYYPELINTLGKPVVLFGGKTEEEDAAWIAEKIHVPFLNFAGKGSLQESGAILRECEYVISHDTGLMHMAAAFKLEVFSIWGNTVPKFGMYPYKTESHVIENTRLRCRPCSKLGYDECPKGHFRCMIELSPEFVLKRISEEKPNGNFS